MNERLIATVEQRRSGARLIKLAGVLDEHNQLRTLKVGTGAVLINMAGIDQITSTGARDWMNWIATLHTKGTRITLVACSPAVVDHLNRTKNFAGAATVKSVQMAYRCATCELDKLQLVQLADALDARGAAPVVACDACGTAMTTVEDAESYFAFVELLREKTTPASPPPKFPRGSAVTAEHLKKISNPDMLSRASRPSMSAYQLPDGKRSSREDLGSVEPAARELPRNGFYLVAIVAIIALLLGAVGVFMYLLI